MSIWVVNTSPLVFLGNLGRLELLRHEGREVYIPRAVAEEIAEKPDAAAQAVQAVCATWIQVRNVTDQTAVTLVQFVLCSSHDFSIASLYYWHSFSMPILTSQDFSVSAAVPALYPPKCPDTL